MHIPKLQNLLCLLVALGISCSPAAAQRAPISYDGSVIPQALQGPFISDPAVIALLDRVDPRGCEHSGALVFGCLIQRQSASPEAFGEGLANPFKLGVASQIVSTIVGDLNISSKDDGTPFRLPVEFLTSPFSRVELVGVVNRMDRQFVRDIIPGHEGHDGCGEISAIYRFAYRRQDGDQGSRLPVTMNVVFPAIPTNLAPGAATCADIASRWLSEMRKPAGRDSSDVVKGLTDPQTGILTSITGQDIFRIELNMQVYRIPVGKDQTRLGSTAKYIMRVFRWDPTLGVFFVSHLANQIDRARLLGNPEGDENSCTRETKSLPKAEFIAWLTSPRVLEDVDRGTLTIPLEYVACRAVTGSPGGQYRSLNQPFWNAVDSKEQIISDSRIQAALDAYLAQSSTPFSFMKSVDDVRTRLNDATCSGCHQARAIAGFHFPGADRPGTPSFNAVLLPGSPHFYGDQPRRAAILETFATTGAATFRDLANSYAARPLNHFRPELLQTNLIGGWGATCLVDWETLGTQRQWGCAENLQCKSVYQSTNAPNLGTCLSEAGFEIGDPMQVGDISTNEFGVDMYTRRSPSMVGGSTLINPPSIPSPRHNSLYVAHQEYHEGTSPPATSWETARTLRDAQTGGFPGGMLRLSECVGLPGEATCGLTAVTGFNDCVAEADAKVTDCFVRHTAYAGLRACDAATPCRDDYICLQPIGYNQSNAAILFEKRNRETPGDPPEYAYGEQQPDLGWLQRNDAAGDQRGYCMPPYFVMQFRVDKHPAPAN